MRVTKSDLDRFAYRLSELVRQDLTVEWLYGKPRLFTHGGSRAVSPRLTTSEMWLWMQAFEMGIHVGAGK